MKRNTRMVSLVSVLCFSFFFSPMAMARSGNRVIYGSDDRLDLYQVNNSLHLKLADSTVALVKAADLTKQGTVYKISAGTFGSSFSLCSSEPFFDQPNAAFCSGALVGEKYIITAGHCITDKADCASTKFVFNYAVKASGQYPTEIAAEDVVGCKQIIKREENSFGADFAVIELTRKITHHEPLEINRAGGLSAGDTIGVIGHPSGLPTKVAFGATVRNTGPAGFFVANLDTYGGNSGSAVFNAVTGKIEGILVRGENDFEFDTDNNCRLSNICTSDGCRGEDVTKISVLKQYIPSI